MLHHKAAYVIDMRGVESEVDDLPLFVSVVLNTTRCLLPIYASYTSTDSVHPCL